MLVKSLSLGAARPGGNAQVALRAAAQALLASTPGLRQVQLLRVLRHIPTDSVSNPAQAGAAPGDGAIESVLELHFEDAASAQACAGRLSWSAFLMQVRSAAPVLFSFDTQPNVPIAPAGRAAEGGFRRWMLLARKADTQEQFRNAWFGRHADLVKRLPHVEGYLQNLVTRRYDADGREVAYEALPVDGIAQLCFADEAAMNAAYTSEARLPLRDDGRQLLGRITTTLVQGEVLS